MLAQTAVNDLSRPIKSMQLQQQQGKRHRGKFGATQKLRAKPSRNEHESRISANSSAHEFSWRTDKTGHFSNRLEILDFLFGFHTDFQYSIM
jgi:hypothetical protein